MINEYLYSLNQSSVHAFSDVKAFADFVQKNTGFVWGKRIDRYQTVIGLPLGIGEDPKTHTQGALYQVYGIAGQSKHQFLLGRKVPKSMTYDVTLKSFKTGLYQVTEHFAVSNDVRSQTSDLLNKIQKDHRKQVSGVIVDNDLKLIILTSVLPHEMKDQQLEPVDKKEG